MGSATPSSEKMDNAIPYANKKWVACSDNKTVLNKLCGSRHNMPRPSPPSVGAEAPRAAEPTAHDRNVGVGSHGEYVPTVTAAAA